MLRAKAGDAIADTWKPLVIAAIDLWNLQGDMQAALIIDGKKILVGGQVATAQGVLDVIADTFGDDVLTNGQTFANANGLLGKGK